MKTKPWLWLIGIGAILSACKARNTDGSNQVNDVAVLTSSGESNLIAIYEDLVEMRKNIGIPFASVEVFRIEQRRLKWLSCFLNEKQIMNIKTIDGSVSSLQIPRDTCTDSKFLSMEDGIHVDVILPEVRKLLNPDSDKFFGKRIAREKELLKEHHEYLEKLNGDWKVQTAEQKNTDELKATIANAISLEESALRRIEFLTELVARYEKQPNMNDQVESGLTDLVKEMTSATVTSVVPELEKDRKIEEKRFPKAVAMHLVATAFMDYRSYAQRSRL